MAGNKDFGELKFGVDEVASLKQITDDLNNIVGQINKTPFQIKFTFNKEDLKEVQKALADIDAAEKRRDSSKKKQPQDAEKRMMRAIALLKQMRSAIEPLKSDDSKWATNINWDTAEAKEYKRVLEGLRLTLHGFTQQNLSDYGPGGHSFSEAEVNTILGAEKAYRQLLNVRMQLDKTVSIEKKLESTSLTYDKLTNKLTTYYEGLKDSIGRSPQMVAEYQRVLNSLETRSFGKNTTAAAQAVQEFMIRVQQAGLTSETFGVRLKRVFSEKLYYGLVSGMAMYARRLAVQIYENVKTIDTAMTELRKVTDETEATYNSFLSNATTRAKTLGTTLSDIIDATSDFARLGYNIEDASTLADVATIYKNVGDGIEDISTASESIISTMQAFGIAASDAMSIVDKFNITGNNFAISSAGVGEALVRSASALAAANNTLDESIALATAANTIVQNPDSVGTTLKTISMYLRAAKTEAEEAGESTDGMANSVSELRAEILALTGNKVDIQIDEENFKSTYQIIKELSQIWSELDDISQANILEMIGGKRNANVTAALVENFSIAEKVLATAGDAAGSALAENEKYLESIDGKLSKLSASFQSLSSNVLDSDLVKFGIDLLTGIVDIADALAEVNALLPITIGLFTAIKSVGRPEYEGFHECAHVSSGGDAERVYVVTVA